MTATIRLNSGGDWEPLNTSWSQPDEWACEATVTRGREQRQGRREAEFDRRSEESIALSSNATRQR